MDCRQREGRLEADLRVRVDHEDPPLSGPTSVTIAIYDVRFTDSSVCCAQKAVIRLWGAVKVIIDPLPTLQIGLRNGREASEGGLRGSVDCAGRRG
jgi:hypothetical protein